MSDNDQVYGVMPDSKDGLTLCEASLWINH